MGGTHRMVMGFNLGRRQKNKLMVSLVSLHYELFNAFNKINNALTTSDTNKVLSSSYKVKLFYLYSPPRPWA